MLEFRRKFGFVVCFGVLVTCFVGVLGLAALGLWFGIGALRFEFGGWGGF